MSVITFAGPASSVSNPSTHIGSWAAHVSAAFAAVGQRLLRLIGKALAARHARNAIRELNQLDDRILHDIGLSRSSIEHVVRGRMLAMAEELGRESDNVTQPLQCDCAACTRRC